MIDYMKRLGDAVALLPVGKVESLAIDLQNAWGKNRQIFLCGNGGSAANAAHIVNDLLYGIAKNMSGPGMRAHALSANQAIITCLANDHSYDDIFSEQLKVLAQKDDLLLVLSGSGNSPNIVRALTMARELGVTSWAILGYSGGKALEAADTAIHIPVDDMQISEDLQLIIGHMLMQWLAANPVGEPVK